MKVESMSIFSKLKASVRGSGKPASVEAPAEAERPTFQIPTVKFDADQITDEVKFALAKNIRNVEELEERHFEKIFGAALLSISRGRDLSVLASAIIELQLPGMTKKRAGEISHSLNNKATALMDKNQQVTLGIRYATWRYSGAPCQVNTKKPSAQEIQQDTAHKAANGKQYEIKKGLLLNGRLLQPGEAEGCKCVALPVVPGFS